MSVTRPTRGSPHWAPDFFIAGAMKCGTTTLHRILALHPDIFIPRGELFYFDIDDFQQHPDFFSYNGTQWRDFDFDRNLETYSAWYQAFFTDARAGQLTGDDSTTYLASARAPARIARFNPTAKIIVMLRDPASRTYSNYWHLLRHGRAHCTFEDSLRLHPETLVSRSFYKPQLDMFLRHFPRESIHIALLEDLATDPRSVVHEACRFLGVAPDIPNEALATHVNRGDAPRSLPLQIWRNRLLWRRDTQLFFERLPGPKITAERAHWSGGLVDRLYRRMNRGRRKPPPMNPATRRFLNQLFRRENEGLDALVGRDLGQSWYRD